MDDDVVDKEEEEEEEEDGEISEAVIVDNAAINGFSAK